MLKQFIKVDSHRQILFHNKGNINENIVELDVNVLSPAAMTKIKIILHKPKVILDNKF
jgi:hypothetical protein